MQKTLQFNSARVFDAISRIGYKPSSAIADIIDNSISASATVVNVIIDILPDKTIVKGNNVNKVIIIDNGSGMDENGIYNALTLGSPNDNYGKDSLSKYGVGLKSAGFSLGTKITVTSKQASGDIHSWYLDREKLDDGYIIYKTENTQLYLQEFNEMLPLDSSFTIIEISNCSDRTIQSAKQINDELIYRLGVIYYPKFIIKDLEITIRISKNGNHIIDTNPISAKDILFRKFIQSEEFDTDNYDCVNPIRVLKEEIDIKGVARKALLEIVIFPMDTMKNDVKLSPEVREQIFTYDINNSNHGFFIYRNDRLISWANRMKTNKNKNIIGRDLLGFRASLNIYTEHDEALNVDVSKQHLDIPDDILETLESLCRNAKEYSEQAFDKCREFMKTEREAAEGENFTEKNKYLSEEDPDEELETPTGVFKINREEAEKRKKSLVNEIPPGKYKEESDENQKQPERFLKIRYSNNLPMGKFWVQGYNADNGVFAHVNKNHNFYSNIISRLIGKNDVKEAIEGIIWALAVAENKTIQNLTEVSQADIEKVLEKFQRMFTYNLDTWSNNNNDLQL